MDIINAFFNWLMSKRMAQIEDFMRRPHEVQQTVFEGLMAAGRETEWGRQYGYTRIRNSEQYAREVPMSSYEDLYPYIERTLKGEQGVLWNTEIKWFSKSSGTTNARSKFIPISKESLDGCHYKAGKDMMALYIHLYPETKFFLGKSLGIGGSLHANPFNDRTQCGDVSAVLMKNLPIWAEYIRTPSLDIALMEHWEDKLARMVETVSKENVTTISGVPTWTMVLLQRILEYTGKQTIAEVWPNLEVFVHGAVAFGPYRDSFRQLIGRPDMRFMETYNASEGFFGVQDQRDTEDEMLLMLDYGIYYEFIPLEHIQEEHPRTVALHEVELGKNYAVVISTNGGLWRYKIGDTIRFTSLTPYRIKVSGRTKHFINAFGEEVVIDNAEQAIIEACRQTAALVSNFTAAPVYLGVGQKGGHEWVIEFEKDPADLNRFVSVLDQTLRQVNSDYDAKRQKDIALVLPLVRVAPHGTFYEWMRRRGKLGGQNKVPRLSNSREYVEDLLSMIQPV